MDCGHAFEKLNWDAIYNCEKLDKIINDITDIKLLGSAICSRWIYFNHCAYDEARLLEFKNRSWLILALVDCLCSQYKIIVSNDIFYGPSPKPDYIVKQHMIINSDYQLWFFVYAFGYGYGKYEKTQTKNYKIAKETPENILNKVATYVRNEDNEMYATDIGSWKMEITNAHGNSYKFRGSLCANFEVDRIELSELICASLKIDDLYVFDGKSKSDKINRISVDYHRVSKIKSKQPVNEEFEHVTWDYTEQLIIDRETETIEYIQNIGTGCAVSHKYNVQYGISALLDDLDSEYLFEYMEDNIQDVIDTPNETKEYTITIDFKKKPQRIIKGIFDKNGLPEDFSDFAENIFSFMKFYDLGEILNPYVYEKARCSNVQYMYCSITFNDAYKTYYYISDDDSIKIGDYVIVEAGYDNRTAVVKVVDIEYFYEDDVPFPVNKTKHIICKYEEDDFDM